MRRSIAAARTSGPTAAAEGVSVFEFRFSAGDPTFAGHFPQRPLLPGAFQIEMARAAAEWLLGGSLAVREIARAKFLRPILPEQNVRGELKVSEAEGLIRVRAGFSVDGQRVSEVVLELWRSA